MDPRGRPASAVLGPKRPDATVCWCLSYGLPAKENRTLRGTERAEKVAQLMRQGPPGALAYDGDEVVGWAEVTHASIIDVGDLVTLVLRRRLRPTGMQHVLFRRADVRRGASGVLRGK